MKRAQVLSLILVVVLVASLFAGCTGGGAATTTPVATAAPTATVAPEREAVTWRMSHGLLPTMSIGVGGLAFADKMAELSDGKVTIDVYDSASIGADVVTAEYVMMDDLDLAQISSFAMASTVGIDAALMYDLPWHTGGNAADLPTIFANDPAYKIIFDDMLAEKGLKQLGWGHIGAYGFGATSMLTNAEQINGAKIRTAENAMIVDLFNSLGVKPVVININEVFTAIQQGVCDGIYTTLSMMYMMKTYEIANQIAEYDNAWCYTWLIINKDRYDALDAEMQGWLTEAGATYTTETLAQVEKDDAMIIKAFEDSGATYYMLTDAEKQAFSDQCGDLRTKWRDLVGADVYDMSVEYIATLG